jgi:DNA-binding beta-propeller fold protein YncE
MRVDFSLTRYLQEHFMQVRLPLFIAFLGVIPSVVACSSSSTISPADHVAPNSRFVPSVRAALRFGLSEEQMSAARLARGTDYISATKNQQTLFISDLQASTIRLFPANKKNPTQIGSITDGINEPVGVAVDDQGTLYVANNGNSTVTVYPAGQTTPSRTLTSQQIVYPNGIAVDNKGTIYVTSGANVGSCYVLLFPQGSSEPSSEIDGFDLPIGLAINKGNLFVGDAGEELVWEVPKGSSTPVRLNLTGMANPTGVAIDPSNNLWISNDIGHYDTVLGFAPGQTKPFATITDGLQGPYALGFGRGGRLFVANNYGQPPHISGYKKNQSLFEEFAGELELPAGVAVFPPAKP